MAIGSVIHAMNYGRSEKLSFLSDDELSYFRGFMDGMLLKYQDANVLDEVPIPKNHILLIDIHLRRLMDEVTASRSQAAQFEEDKKLLSQLQSLPAYVHELLLLDSEGDNDLMTYPEFNRLWGEVTTAVKKVMVELGYEYNE